jgi:glucuronokinase
MHPNMHTYTYIYTVAKQCVQDRNWDRFRELMNENFALRREVFTDAAIGDKNLQMAEIAREHGAGCKFPGSGGAVVGLAPSQDALVSIKNDMESAGFVFCVLEFYSPPEENFTTSTTTQQVSRD